MTFGIHDGTDPNTADVRRPSLSGLDFAAGRGLSGEAMTRIAPLKEYVLSEATRHKIASDMSQYSGRDDFIVFLSLSDAKNRSLVAKGAGETLELAWETAERNVCDLASKKACDAVWAKADIVNSIEAIRAGDLEKRVVNIYNSFYFRKGIAFDDNFSVAFLEAEVNSSNIIDYNIRKPDFFRRLADRNSVALNLHNINALENYYGGGGLKKIPDVLTLFTTTGFIADGDGIHDLHSDEASYGRRITDVVDAEIAEMVIKNVSDYLYSLLQPDGKFIYGYFPISGRTMNSYNILRHAGTVWSLIHRYRTAGDKTPVPKLNAAIDYLLNTAIVYKSPDTAYVVDLKNDEVKLGGNGLAILMLTGYMDVFKVDTYVGPVRHLANGILELQDSAKGSFYHVLHSRDFSRKEEFRTAYYDGEAAFGLTQAYACTRDPRYLDGVRLAAEHFIAKRYTKYRDHWVAYALNEITKYLPEPRYYIFALQNVKENLNAIYSGATVNTTHLELLMAGWETCERLLKSGIEIDYLKEFDVRYFAETVYKRAFHMLNGYFYPEFAMYMSSPSKIVNSFFVRQNHFRTRIDDMQHFIAGYSSYALHCDRVRRHLSDEFLSRIHKPVRDPSEGG